MTAALYSQTKLEASGSQEIAVKQRFPAIILKSMPFREHDSLITLLSRDYGRIHAVARSARRSQKRFMGGLDLFDCGLFALEPARGSRKQGSQPLIHSQLYNLNELDSRESWPNIRNDLLLYRLACYCAEITLSLTAEGDASSGNLFNPLYFTLSTLNKQFSEDHAYSSVVFYNLLLLQRSGMNYLDDKEIDSSAMLFQWFESMLQSMSIILPSEANLAKQGLRTLSKHTQSIIGHVIHSATGLF